MSWWIGAQLGMCHNKMLGAANTMAELNTMIAARAAITVDGAPLLKRTSLEDDDFKSGTSASAAATLIMDNTT